MKVVWDEIEEKLSDTIFELFKNGINKLKDVTADLEANGGDEVKKQFDNMFDNPLGQLDDLSASFGPKNESNSVISEDNSSLRATLHTLVGNEMKLGKRADMYGGVSHHVEEHEKAEKELEKFLQENPAMLEFVEEVEEYFMKQLYK